MTHAPQRRDHQDPEGPPAGGGEDRGGRPQADDLDNRWSFGATEAPGRGQKGGGDPGGRGPDGPSSTADILRGTALLMAVCLGFALPQPTALIAPVFSGGLLAAAGAAAAWAAVMRQPVRVPYLTRWDQAAILLAASLFAGLFTDAEAVRQAVQEAQSAAGAAGGGG